MPEETLLAFDYGETKIGVAIGNTLTAHARPLEIIKGEAQASKFARIEQLLAEWQPQRIVVGLPLTTEGCEQPASKRARRFGNQLHGRYGVAVVLVDERGSSMEAQSILGSHAPDDAVAAAIILQRYFDALPAA